MRFYFVSDDVQHQLTRVWAFDCFIHSKLIEPSASDGISINTMLCIAKSFTSPVKATVRFNTRLISKWPESIWWFYNPVYETASSRSQFHSIDAERRTKSSRCTWNFPCMYTCDLTLRVSRSVVLLEDAFAESFSPLHDVDIEIRPSLVNCSARSLPSIHRCIYATFTMTLLQRSTHRVNAS